MPAVIFDLDGTLADTIDDIVASLNHALGQLGLRQLDKAHIMGMLGDGLLALATRASGDDSPETVERLVENFMAHYNGHCLDATRLFPGLAEQLMLMTEAGWPIAVLSNKSHVHTVKVCETLLADWPVVDVRGAKPDVPRKPDPVAAMEISVQLGVEPAETFFVGDSNVDMLTARNAGMVPVGVAWGYRPLAELIGAGAAFIAPEPAKLYSLLVDHANEMQV